MRTLILLSSLWTLATPCSAEQPGGVDIESITQESRAAAQRGLSTLGKLVTEENAAYMGFTGPGDVKRAELDAPLSDFMVGLDSLREYREGQNPVSLLKFSGEVIYPVTIEGSSRSSITLKKEGSEWHTVSVGAPAQTKAMAHARDSMPGKELRSASDVFQVRIPALNLFFVGHIDNGKLMLTSATDSKEYGVQAEATVPAEELFLKLQAAAEKDEGLPR